MPDPACRRPLIPAQSAAFRNNNLDAIRLLMAMAVTWSHSFAIYYGSEDNELLSRLTRGVFNSGNLGVIVFFIISGFLITYSFERSPSAFSYLVKRIRRIHPGYLASILICGFLIAPLFVDVEFQVGSVFKIILLNLLLQNKFPTPNPFVYNPNMSMNGSLWSIPYEFWCYIGVLALGVSGMLRRRGLLVAALILLLLVQAWLDFTGRKPGGGILYDVIGWPYLWFKMLPPFITGMLIYLYRERLPRRPWIAALSIVLTVAAAYLPIGRAAGLLTQALFPLAIAYGVFTLAFSERLPLKRFTKYGDFSYGTYLYAFPIQQSLVALGARQFGFSAFVIASMLLSLAAGVASWYGVERWFLKRERTARAEHAPLPIHSEAPV